MAWPTDVHSSRFGRAWRAPGLPSCCCCCCCPPHGSCCEGTPAGRALYKLRKQTVEPVFGIIKRVMGWRQMSMRGLDKANGEWNLVTMAWNIKRMHVLRAA